MMKVKFSGGCCYCGCDWEEYHLFPEGTTTTDLENEAAELSNHWMDEYGVLDQAEEEGIEPDDYYDILVITEEEPEELKEFDEAYAAGQVVLQGNVSPVG